MPHITSLPDEILLTIAGYIYADDLYDHSMPSLAATSQRFFDITFEVYWLHRVKHFATKSAGDELVVRREYYRGIWTEHVKALDIDVERMRSLDTVIRGVERQRKLEVEEPWLLCLWDLDEIEM